MANEPYLTALASFVLPGNTTSFTVSSIAAGYKDIVIYAQLRGGTSSQPNLRINGDSGGNYDFINNDQTNWGAGYLGMNAYIDTSTAAQAMYKITAFSYAKTDTFKHFLIESSSQTNPAPGGGAWRSTNAITSIQFNANTGTPMNSISRVDVYGVKA